MNSPTVDVVKTKSSQNVSVMSASLRDRLKKCGRYHAVVSSGENSSNIASSELLSLHPRTSVVSNTETISTSTQNTTPKRKISETINDANTNQGSDIIKRKKFTCSKKLQVLGEKCSTSNQTETNLSLSPSPQKLEDESESHVLNVNKDMTNNITLPCVKSDSSRYNDSVSLFVDIEYIETSLQNSSTDKKVNLKDLKTQLEKELKTIEEHLRKLKMVKMYREKNDLTELQKLIDTWRDVSQRALVDLHGLQPPPKPSMTELINHLQIDHELVHFVAEEETFT